MCLSVLLDRALTFVPHVRPRYAFVTSQADYSNSVLHRVSAANVQPL